MLSRFEIAELVYSSCIHGPVTIFPMIPSARNCNKCFSSLSPVMFVKLDTGHEVCPLSLLVYSVAMTIHEVLDEFKGTVKF